MSSLKSFAYFLLKYFLLLIGGMFLLKSGIAAGAEAETGIAIPFLIGWFCIVVGGFMS